MNRMLQRVSDSACTMLPAVAPAGVRGRCHPRAQRGVALAVALILLVIITLIGLAAVSGTIMQSKMASNQYDRQAAFQNAESALHIAEEKILTTPGDIARNCTGGSVICLANPFTDPGLPAGSIHPVSAGTAPDQYTASVLATGQPEYVIELMGDQWLDPSHDIGCKQTANSKARGASACGGTATYYRITARSGDPATIGDRAIVTLQAVIKQD